MAPLPPSQESLIQALESTEDLENVQRLPWKQKMLQQGMGLIQTQVEVCSWGTRALGTSAGALVDS